MALAYHAAGTDNENIQTDANIVYRAEAVQV